MILGTIVFSPTPCQTARTASHKDRTGFHCFVLLQPLLRRRCYSESLDWAVPSTQYYSFTRQHLEENHVITHRRRSSQLHSGTTEGTIQFHDWIGDGWAVLFSHPKDFTPVCTTELGYVAGLGPEFAKRNCKVIGLSVDSVEDHAGWSKDIEETQGHAVNYPLIGDTISP